MGMKYQDVMGRVYELPFHPVRGGEWYAAAMKRGLRSQTSLTTQRNKKRLSGESVAKVMRVYAEFDWGGSDVMLSQDAIAEKAGLSAYTVRRAQQWLVENGWLVFAGRFKVRKHGWKVLLTIPDEGFDASLFDWGDLHPERRVQWLDEADWLLLRLVTE